MHRHERRQLIAEKYSNTLEKLFMSVEEAEMLSVELAHRIAKSYPEVDCVAGIANGGLMISSIVAQELNVPLKVLNIRRRGSYFKRLVYKSERLRSIVALLSRFPPIRFPIYWLMRSLEQPILNQSDDTENYQSIAIVDDAVESGKTLALAIQVVGRQSNEKPFTAVLCCSNKYGAPVVIPDLFMSKRIQHYPWSGNNPQYQEYIQWLKDREIEPIG